MDGCGAGGGPISAEASAALGEGIGLWRTSGRGCDSRAKADQLAASILSWFCNSKGPHYFEDLADMMDAKISELFNADFQDNSFEELAKQLLIMHEECLQSNYSSIEKLRNSHVQGNAVFQSRQIAGDDDDDSDSSDGDDDTSMMDDEAVAAPEEMAVDRPRPSKAASDVDGWTVVPPRRGRGKN
ncbi:hypothetical protein PVAP13_9KG067785 [Panicum virgatum]|uniref:Pre-rRNA-processing protein TSR2 homolog n=1 Tax=Panicum virgatum TaxID=38727 RepID=A0A8T0NCP9_PANVG|nr:hypothetical protein PVAP13_9KG067785 [Panicum virgatum]